MPRPYRYPAPRGEITEAPEPIPVEFLLYVTPAVRPAHLSGVAVAWSGDAVKVRYVQAGVAKVTWVWARHVTRV